MGGDARLDGELTRALKFFKSRILHGPPIEIRAALGQVIHVFTDGAFEPESEHAGFFSEIVPQSLIDVYLTVSRTLYIWLSCWLHWWPRCCGAKIILSEMW